MKTNLYDICIKLEEENDRSCDLFTFTTVNEVRLATGIKLPLTRLAIDNSSNELKSITVSTTKPRSKQVTWWKATNITSLGKGSWAYYHFPNSERFGLCADGLKLVFGRIPKTIYIYQETQQ